MSSLALFKTSLSKVSEGNRLFVRWAAGGAYWWALFLWLPVGCHPFWTSSLARYLPSICLSFAFRLSRERQHISRKLGLADVPCPLFARPIDTHPYIHTHIYMQHALAARIGKGDKAKRQSVKPKAPSKTRPTAAGSGGVFELGSASFPLDTTAIDATRFALDTTAPQRGGLLVRRGWFVSPRRTSLRFLDNIST